MTERGAEAAAAPPVVMAAAATEQQIAEGLELLLRETNTFTSLNGVVQQLESKLGMHLGHKIDFIRSQIHHYILQFQQPQSFLPLHHQHQQVHRTPNFPPAPFSHLTPNFNVRHPVQDYGFRPVLQPPPQAEQLQPQPQPTTTSARVGKKPSATGSKESAPVAKKRRGGPGGLNKLCGVTPELQAIVGQPTMPRTEIVKQLWAYIRKYNLQDPANKRKIICNEELRLVFETDCTDMFKMNKLLSKHILPLEPTKEIAQNSKKPKIDVESDSKGDDPVPIVIISDALANLFGTDEKEMSQAEVLRQIWEYIKVNQLEDPSNSAAIICDAKLQDLLGFERISALEIPETLARRHLFKKS